MENNRLDILRRKNLSTVPKSNFVESLRKLGIPEDATEFLTLEDSDKVRDRVYKGFSARNDILSDVLERRIPLEAQYEIGGILPSSDEIFIIPWNAEILGVLRWPVNIFNVFWQRLVELEPDGWIIVDKNFQNKAVIQVIDDFGKKEIDLGIWGDFWKKHVDQILWKGPHKRYDNES